MKYINKLKIDDKEDILQFVPQKLKYLTENKKIVYKEKNIKTAYLIDIIHKFITRRFFTNKLIINLSSEIMRQSFGTHYNYYINYLTDNNILQKKGNYLVGAKCNSYSLNPIYLHDKLIRWKNSDNILIKKWKKNLVKFEVESLNDTKSINTTVKRRLVDDLFHVEIDFESASKVLLELFQNDSIDDVGYWKNQLSIESIKDGSLFYVEDDYGRLHTNYTVLKKVIRDEHITIEGEEVEEIDIKNSQPLFLSIYMKDNGFDLIHPEEFERYTKSVRDGVIYEEFMKESGWSRKDCKKAMYKVLFANNVLYGKNAKINKYFKNMYPKVWEWLRQVKEDNDTHKIVSHELQRRESDLIFNNICYKVYRKYPSIRLFTVHDSIFFPKKYHEQVREIFYNNLDLIFPQLVPTT